MLAEFNDYNLSDLAFEKLKLKEKIKIARKKSRKSQKNILLNLPKRHRESAGQYLDFFSLALDYDEIKRIYRTRIFTVIQKILKSNKKNIKETELSCIIDVDKLLNYTYKNYS